MKNLNFNTPVNLSNGDLTNLEELIGKSKAIQEVIYNGWEIPSGMKNKDISEVDRIDLSSISWEEDEGSYRSYQLKDVMKKPSSESEVSTLYTENYKTISSTEFEEHEYGTIALHPDGELYVESDERPSGFMWYELETARKIEYGEEVTYRINESLDNLAYGEYCGGNNICGCDGEKYYYPLKVGDYITISKKNPSDSVLAYLYQLNADGTPADNWTADDSNLPRTVQIEKDSVYLQFSSNVSSTPLMINIGSSALTYEPYIPSIAQIKNDLTDYSSFVNLGYRENANVTSSELSKYKAIGNAIPYIFIYSNNGLSLIIGYHYANDEYGSQLKLTFGSDSLQLRTLNDGNWSTQW